jgi:hypothetical protein
VTKVDYFLLSHDELSILSDHLNLTYSYNPLFADPTLAHHVVHKLQRWVLKMSVLSYRMEHVIDEINYWTDLMKRLEVGWIAGSEHKAHGKMDSLLSQPYISPPDYDTVVFPSKKEIMLLQQSAVEASPCRRHEDDEQCTMNSRANSRAAATLVRGGTLPLCRTQSVRSDARRNQGVCGMDNYCKGYQSLCAVLFALCSNDYWKQIASPSGDAATHNQDQRDPAIRLPVHWVVERWEVSVLTTSQG